MGDGFPGDWNAQEEHMKKLAIIGFGGAGYCAAAAARECDPDAHIDVYTDTDIGPYNPMLTTYYVKGSIEYDALFPFGSLEEIEQRLGLQVYRDTPVTGLIPAEKAVCLADGTKRAYDSILVSTGASAFVPKSPAGICRGCLRCVRRQTRYT